MTKALAALAIVAVGSLTALGGCALGTEQQAPAVETAKQGLSVREADESARKLVVLFRKDGREVVFDMRLGDPMESPNLPTETGFPTHMNDVQVLDAAGQPFMMQMGADEFIDHTWRMPHVEGFDEAGRLADFRVVRDSEADWASLALPSWAEDLRLTALDLARSVDRIQAKDGVTPTTPTVPTAPIDGEGTVNGKLLGSLAYGSSSVVKWDYKIYEKDAFMNGSPFDHSAVLLRGWSSSTSVVFSASSCNHGACATSSAMQRSCTMSGFRTDDGTHTRYFFREDQGDTDVNGGCSTAYGAFFDNGKHICNDDTLLQRDAIYYDSSYSRTGGTCSDDYKRYWGPGCH